MHHIDDRYAPRARFWATRPGPIAAAIRRLVLRQWAAALAGRAR